MWDWRWVSTVEMCPTDIGAHLPALRSEVDLTEGGDDNGDGQEENLFWDVVVHFLSIAAAQGRSPLAADCGQNDQVI